MFYTGYNESRSSKCAAGLLLAGRPERCLPNRYEYLWEMGGLAALPTYLPPASPWHCLAKGRMPALWRAKLTDGYSTRTALCL